MASNGGKLRLADDLQDADVKDYLQYLAALLLGASPLLWPAVAPWAVGLLIAGSFLILLVIWWRPRPGPEYGGEVR